MNLDYYCDTGRKIEVDSTISKNQSFLNIIEFLAITKDLSKIVPVFLNVLLAVLYECFAEAGYPIHFITLISGISGSLKTAVSTLLTNLFFGNSKKPRASFNDTAAALEFKMRDHASAVFLVDDFRPSSSAIEKQSMAGKFESVIRFFGDGISKDRGNVNLDVVESDKPRGTCIITAENISGSLSSLLRSLVIHIDRDTFDGKLLAKFQTSPALLSTFLAYFIDFVCTNFPHLVVEIKSNFEEMRKKLSNRFDNYRSIDISIQLLMALNFFEQFGKSVGVDLSIEQLQALESSIISAVKASENISTVLDPATAFSLGLDETIRKGKTIICSSVEAHEAAYASTAGYYYGDGEIYLKPNVAYEITVDYLKANSGHVDLSRHNLFQCLETAEILKVRFEKNGDTSKKLFTCKNHFKKSKRENYLRLTRSKLEEIVSKEAEF